MTPEERHVLIATAIMTLEIAKRQRSRLEREYDDAYIGPAWTLSGTMYVDMIRKLEDQIGALSDKMKEQS
jgi:hypothetical protein